MSFTYIDVSDLLDYLEHHRHVSGIQRVQSNLVRSICLAEQDFGDVQLISLDRDRNWFQLLDKAAMVELMAAVSGAEITHESIKIVVHHLMSDAVQPRFDLGDTYIVAGAFWNFSDLHHKYNKLKRLGVVIGCYIYDIIPINQPDFCAEVLASAFKMAFERASQFFDFIMTISDYTRDQVNAYLRSSGLPSTVTATVRLAHTMSDHPPPSAGFDLGGLTFNNFVLCVGTIEARKNHQLLYQVWKLLAEAGVDPIPKLVIVGRWGWRVDDLKAQLKATNGLNGSIVVLPDADDETLELLYRECSFTIFPSFVEGWGMPVGESLVHGRFCLASGTSSLPEVGGRFVEYIDPYNARGTSEVVQKYLTQPALLKQKNEMIRSDFIARTWWEFRDDFLATASRCRDHVGPNRKPAVYPILRPGDSLDASDRPVPTSAAFALIDPALAFIEGWDVPEHMGRWMRGRHAEISFCSDAPLDGATLRLRLFSVPWAVNNKIIIKCQGYKLNAIVPEGAHFSILIGPVDLQGIASPISIHFELEGLYDHTTDPREICVGLASLLIVSNHSSIQKMDA